MQQYSCIMFSYFNNNIMARIQQLDEQQKDLQKHHDES